MKKYFKYLREDRLLLRLFIFAFILIVITVVYILFNYQSLPPLLPIFNQLPWGEKRLAGTFGIFIPPSLVFAIFIFNIFASSLSYPKSPLMARIFAVTSFLTALLTFLFVVRTITLII